VLGIAAFFQVSKCVWSGTTRRWFHTRRNNPLDDR
jgi:hypothetical protein